VSTPPLWYEDGDRVTPRNNVLPKYGLQGTEPRDLIGEVVGSREPAHNVIVCFPTGEILDFEPGDLEPAP
jgi:hypothetical protein